MAEAYRSTAYLQSAKARQLPGLRTRSETVKQPINMNVKSDPVHTASKQTAVL